MKSDISSIPSPEEKQSLYADIKSRASGLLDSEVDTIAKMAGLVSLLHGAMPHYFWTGFYRVMGGSLVIGPYQGTPGCSRIAWGKGVCGTAWKTGETQLVEDVHAFPGHIACDSRSESEIVVPAKDSLGRVIAVLDVDSTLLGAFDAVDAKALESLVGEFL